MNEHWDRYDSPIGPLTIVRGERGISGLHFPNRPAPVSPSDRDPAAVADVSAQLASYFAGERRTFAVEVDLSAGTEFQQSVWRALLQIPYGQTVSYGELARRIGRFDRVRAVAATVGRTPVPIVVPCHRVIGADGSLTGYGGGLDRKRTLLELEGAIAQLSLV
jgi:methylated-DNA-[protein]-cysteine S-methyltransferase